MANNPPYRPGTILAEMQVDILASTKRPDLTILHDKPLADLKGLELDVAGSVLFFVFPHEKRELGAPVRKALIPRIQAAETAGVFLIEPATRKAISGVSVPVRIIEPEPEEGSQKELRGKFKRRTDK